jgi:hypothetical protein
MRKDDRLIEIDRLEREIEQRRVKLSKADDVLTSIEWQIKTEVDQLTKRLHQLQAVQPKLF